MAEVVLGGRKVRNQRSGNPKTTDHRGRTAISFIRECPTNSCETPVFITPIEGKKEKNPVGLHHRG